MRSCNNGMDWNKPWCMCPSTSPPLPETIWCMYSCSLLSITTGGGESALQSASLHNMQAAVTPKVWWSLFMCGVIGGDGCRRLCLWSWKKGWAEYVSVGGTVILGWSGRRLRHHFLFFFFWHSQRMPVNSHNFKVNVKSIKLTLLGSP